MAKEATVESLRVEHGQRTELAAWSRNTREMMMEEETGTSIELRGKCRGRPFRRSRPI